VLAAFAFANVPADAVHEYVMALGLGARAEAETASEVLTKTEDGLAVTEFHVAQLNVLPVTSAEPASDGAVAHWSWTETFVVVRAAMANVAEPLQVAVPSLVTAESAML
jgi:hypothetical protein